MTAGSGSAIIKALMDLLHSVIDFTLLPAIVSQAPDQVMPIFIAAEEDPFFAVVMSVTEPILLLGTLLLAISTIRARVLSRWPAWLLLVTVGIALTALFTTLPAVIELIYPVVFYLGLAGFGVALLVDKGEEF